MPSKEWWSEYLAPLLGGEIIEVGLNAYNDNEPGFPYLKVETQDLEVYTIEISQDAEANGPGFILGLPQP